MKITVGGYCRVFYDENYCGYSGFSVKNKFVEVDGIDLCLKEEHYKFIGFIDFNSYVNFTDNVPFDIYRREYHDGIIMEDNFDINEFKVHYGEVRLNGNRTGEMLIDGFYYKNKRINIDRVR